MLKRARCFNTTFNSTPKLVQTMRSFQPIARVVTFIHSLSGDLIGYRLRFDWHSIPSHGHTSMFASYHLRWHSLHWALFGRCNGESTKRRKTRDSVRRMLNGTNWRAIERLTSAPLNEPSCSVDMTLESTQSISFCLMRGFPYDSHVVLAVSCRSTSIFYEYHHFWYTLFKAHRPHLLTEDLGPSGGETGCGWW